MKYVTEVKEVCKWNSDDVRAMCMRYGFYTCGDCACYSRILNFVDDVEPSIKTMLVVANDIAIHSNDLTTNCEVEHIMFLLSNEIVHRFYEVKI